uniref:DUF4094 domain-containing protein n=1 Tax=Leersia perrieri TaxID=77586 RepID=A0A0D9V8I3_9ORYZ
MILRTPPQRKRRADSDIDIDIDAEIAAAAAAATSAPSPVSDRRLVLYDRPTDLVVAGVSGEPMDDMVCTYHCRQMVKSEFMVALDTAEKQVQEYRAALDDLENRLSKSEDERTTCQDKLNYVEQELAATKGRESALQERLLKELGDYQERYRDQIKKIGELEAQLKKEVDSRIAAESSSASAKESVKELEVNLQRLTENSEREKKALKKELSYLQDDTKLSVSKLDAELERMKLRAQNSENEAKLLNEQLEDLKKQLDESVREKNEMEHKLLSSSALSNQRTPTDDQKLIKLLQEELRNYEKEVDEARRLKSSHTNAELLKEKLLEEQGRRERVEMELSKLQEVEAKAQKLELELTSCTALLSNIPDVSSFGDIPQKIADLQKQALTNLNKVGEVTSQLKELQVALEFADLSKQRAEGEATLAKERAESATREVKRLELLLAAVSEERDRLRKDHAMSTNQKSRDGDDASSRFCAFTTLNKMCNKSFEVTMQSMESDLSRMEKVVRELESTIHDQRELISQQHTELSLMNEKLSMEGRKAKSLERDGDQLRSQVALLESKLGHGDYSASSTKVLRMVNTLAVDNEAKQTIEALQAELKKTKERLQAVEELKGQAGEYFYAFIHLFILVIMSAIWGFEFIICFSLQRSESLLKICHLKDYVGTVVDANIAEKLAQLKTQIATLEKREERYKAVFAERISVFRKACCSLFGYKIVMNDQQQSNGIPVTRFILQSVYAQNDDEKLEFDYESGSTSIVVNDYTSQHEIAQQTLSSSERQQQQQSPEKKPARARPPLPGKAVAALCVASFVVGLLLSGRVAMPLLPPGSSSPAARASNYMAFSSGCENKRAKLGEGNNPTDIMNEVSRTHHAIQGEAEEAGEGEGDSDPVRDRAERRGGAGPGGGRGGGRERGLHAAGSRGGIPRAFVQDQDLLHHRRRHLGRRLLRQGRRRRMLTSRLAKYRTRPRVYVGCMKSGPVLSQKGVKYHEPEYWKFGDEGNKYFRHATGQIYAVSKDLAAYISINQPILHRFANEDVSLGAWLIGLEVEHVDDRSMCCATPPVGSASQWIG